MKTERLWMWEAEGRAPIGQHVCGHRLRSQLFRVLKRSPVKQMHQFLHHRDSRGF